MRKVIRYRALLLIVFLLVGTVTFPPFHISDIAGATGTYFVSVWDTTLVYGSSSNEYSLKLPLMSTGTYDFTVNWGDSTSSKITSWDQANTTHSYGEGNEGIKTLNISGTIIGFSFNNSDEKEKILDITKWGQLRLGNGGAYFKGCKYLDCTATDTLDLTGTTILTEMFKDAAGYWSGFNGSIGSWDTKNVTDMSSMFYNARFFSRNISGWDTGNVTNMSGMFQEAGSFNTYIGSWDTSKVTDMHSMFYSAYLFNQNISGWDVSNVTTMVGMFQNAYYFNKSIIGWDTGNVTTMNSMFRSAAFFNANLGLDTSSVTNMGSMFKSAPCFDKDISGWDTGNVTTMANMFEGTIFNQDINGWDVSKVTTMTSMFHAANGFTKDLGSWDTGNVTTMNSMFKQTNIFNGSIGSWDTKNVTDMSSMFEEAYAFNRYIGGWDTGNVTTMNSMFRSAFSFNTVISGWNTKKVTDMAYMFMEAYDFNQNIGGLNITNVTTITWILFHAELSTSNYDNLLIGWGSQNVKNSLSLTATYCKYHAAPHPAGLARTDLINNHSWSISDAGPTAEPTVTTDVATGVEETSATLQGTLTNDGGDGTTYVRFEYGQTMSYGTVTPSQIKTTGQTFSQSIIGLNQGTVHHYRAIANNSDGIVYGADVSFITKPNSPTALTITNTGANNIQRLNWMIGLYTSRTVICARNGTNMYGGSYYPLLPTSNTSIYNGTGSSTTVNNILLEPGKPYYYRAWGYVFGPSGEHQFSDGYTQAMEITKPYAPTNALVTQTPGYANITWTKGKGANNTIIRYKTTGFPTSATDGILIYNGTGVNKMFAVVNGTTYYFTGFSYTSWINPTGNQYSDNGTNFVSVGFIVNCFDEITHKSLKFNITITNLTGSKTYTQKNITATLVINISSVPTGNDCSMIIKVGGYKDRVYYVDILPGMTYTLNSYMPKNNNTIGGVVVPTTLYYLRVIETIFTQMTFDDVAVQGVKVSIKSYDSVAQIYVDVSILKTDANGYVCGYLIPTRQYKILINKTGYYDMISDFIPELPDLWGNVNVKIFKIIRIESGQNYTNENRTITLTPILYSNGSMYINYYSDIGGTSTSLISIYNITNNTRTWIASYSYSTCNMSLWQTGLSNTSRYLIELYVNFSNPVDKYFVAKTIYINGSITYDAVVIEKKAIDVYGSWKPGYVNTFIIFLPFIGLLLLIGRMEPGLGAIAGGLWLCFLNSIINNINALNITGVGAFCVAIGIILMLVKGRKKKL